MADPHDQCPECEGRRFRALYCERGGVRVECYACGYVFLARIPEEYLP